jgi:hypothetical protein
MKLFYFDNVFEFCENILNIVHLMRILTFLLIGNKRGATNPCFDLKLTHTYATGYLFVS